MNPTVRHRVGKNRRHAASYTRFLSQSTILDAARWTLASREAKTRGRPGDSLYRAPTAPAPDGAPEQPRLYVATKAIPLRSYAALVLGGSDERGRGIGSEHEK